MGEGRVALAAFGGLVLAAAVPTVMVLGLDARGAPDAFRAPGTAVQQLDSGTQVVYLSAGAADDGDARFRADIRVTGPDGRAVALDTASRAPDVDLGGEVRDPYRDHGRFTVPAEGAYRGSVTGSEERRVIVMPPRSLWRQYWPIVAICGMFISLPFLVIGLVKLAGGQAGAGADQEGNVVARVARRSTTGRVRWASRARLRSARPRTARTAVSPTA